MEHDFWCNVACRATWITTDNGIGGIQLDGETKIDEFDIVGFRVNHDVVWFHITINNIFGMHVNHCGRNLSTNQEDVHVGNIIIRNKIMECNAPSMFHNDDHFGGGNGVPIQFHNSYMSLKRLEDGQFIDKHADANAMLHNLVHHIFIIVSGGKDSTKFSTS